ncbi:MAG TPA: hypothetical protein PLD20_25305 [Blastocatellia bacterium]|nr:hypothetical protein [Blastocatellia bacterium]HMV86664.1 hypothetical protein [Blastocatellia bacterium]HMX24124.1 hypothetical protein [Blastocatellia bacterium]HMY70526.1 hypothetical protein [Blastocatellia bacterium]HMZ21276.1 hypothetical protein [Blastocatellia bacterium]
MQTTMAAQSNQQTEVAQRFAKLDEPMNAEKYNFEYFRAKHFLEDVKRTMAAEGIRPGQPAPDFELPLVGGGRL